MNKKEINTDESMTIELSKPIQAHGEIVSSLTLREPTLGALEDVNLTVVGDGDVKFNLGDLQGLIANMADIPKSSARQISIRDLPKFMEAGKGFFGEFLKDS